MGAVLVIGGLIGSSGALCGWALWRAARYYDAAAALEAGAERLIRQDDVLRQQMAEDRAAAEQALVRAEYLACQNEMRRVGVQN